MGASLIEIKIYIPYNVSFEEILTSIASSILFKELELNDYAPEICISEIIESAQYGYTTSASNDSTGIKFVRITDIQQGKIDWASVPYCKCDNPEKYILKANDILFARTGGTTGKSFIVKGTIPTSIFASYLIRIRAKAGVDPDFLYWYFKTKQYWSQIISEKIGSAQPNVNAKKLSNILINVPEKNIQKLIADYLNAYNNRIFDKSIKLPELPKVITGSDKVINKIEQLMFRIRESFNFQSSAIAEADELLQSAIYDVFNKVEPIEMRSLGTDIDIISGATPRTDNPIYWGGNIIWTTPADMGKLISRDIVNSRRKITEEGLKSCSTQLVQSGNIVLSSRAPIGHLGIARVPLCINQGCKIFITPPDTIPEFLYYSIKYKLEEIKSVGSGTTFHEVSTAKLKSVKIPFVNIEKQHQIVHYLDSLYEKAEKLKNFLSATTKDIEELIPGILDKVYQS